MRTSLVAALAAVLGLGAAARAGDSPARESPWAKVPVGTVLEFLVTEESTQYLSSKDRDKNKKHEESTETWTVVAKDADAVTVEKSVGGKTSRDRISLEPPPPDPVEPTESSGPVRADEPLWSGREKVTTPAGTFECVVISQHHAQLESDWSQSWWKAAGVPVPVRETNRSASGAGMVREETRTRTLTRYAPGGGAAPAAAVAGGGAWAAYPVGTVFEVAAEQEVEGPRGGKEKTSWTETWTVRAIGAKEATLEVKAPKGASERREPLEWKAPEPQERERPGPESHSTAVEKESLTTPLGTFECVHVRNVHTIVDAGFVDDEWRAPSLPVPVRIVTNRGAKYTTTIITWTVVKATRPK
jgi:hypothetical protein